MPEDDPDRRCATNEYYSGFECLACNPSCVSCLGGLATDCIACKLDNEMLVDGQCLPCPVGTTANYLNQCIEQCDTNPHNLEWLECHDGNLANGDGCTSMCEIEDGYHCFKP